MQGEQFQDVQLDLKSGLFCKRNPFGLKTVIYIIGN